MSAPADRYVRFPPKWLNVLVPVGPRSATALGTTLYTASRPIPLLAQRALWSLARIGGARLLPGPRETWSPDLPADVYARLRQDWAGLTGGDFDAVAVYNRPQTYRRGLVLLLCAGRDSVVVRVREDPNELNREQLVSRAAQQLGLQTFRVPQLRGAGETGGWHWTAYEVMSIRPHRPARAAGPTLTAEISRLVEAAIVRPAGTPDHWLGAHGDLTGWNLRRAGSRTWLIDWEDAGWAPPGTDELYFAATSSALSGAATERLPLSERYPEAADRLAVEVAARPAGPDEVQLRDRLLVLLGAG